MITVDEMVESSKCSCEICSSQDDEKELLKQIEKDSVYVENEE